MIASDIGLLTIAFIAAMAFRTGFGLTCVAAELWDIVFIGEGVGEVGFGDLFAVAFGVGEKYL